LVGSPQPIGAADVTIGASTTREKLIAPSHCWRVSTPPYPLGGAFGGVAASVKKVVLAQVPLMRT
jgi:hypothetical protein